MQSAVFINKHVARANRNLLLVNAILFAALLWWAQSSSVYLYNFFFGPFEVDARSLSAISSLASTEKRFVEVNGERAMQTGMQQVSQTKNKYSKKVIKEEIRSDYIALVLDKRLLVVKASHGNENQLRFRGFLAPLPSKVEHEVIDELDRQNPGFKSLFFRFMVEESDYRFAGYIGFLISIPLFGLSLWNVNKALRRSNDISKSPIVKSVQRYGDLLSVSSEIDKQINSEHKTYRKTCVLTDWWFFRARTFGLDLVRFDRIAWVYKKVTRHSVNFIPAGKSYGIVVSTQFGETFEVDMSDRDASDFLNKMISSAPWIVFGYTDELKALWDKQRDKFITGIENRKKKLVEASTAGME